MTTHVNRHTEEKEWKDKRTTVVLRPDDQSNVEVVRRAQGGISETEAIRRSLRLTRELLEFQKYQGGHIVLERANEREVIRFL